MKPKTVLVVDDARIVRQFCAVALMRVGCNVIQASNGKEALEKLQGTTVDVIVTDIIMPEMDGIQLIKELRLRDDTRSTPIIVLSTLSQQERVDEGKAAGANGWLFKPFNGEKLIRKVWEV